MNLTAYNGHLNVVKWLCENGTEECIKCAMGFAADNGHLEVVKFFHGNASINTECKYYHRGFECSIFGTITTG